MLELVFAGIKFITSNWWRSSFLVVAIIALGLYTAIHVQSLRLREAVIALNEEKAKIAKIVVDGIVLERKITASALELEALRKKQLKQEKDFKDKLKNFPVDCEGAAQRAATILRKESSP